MNKLWKKFEKLSDKCYTDMITGTDLAVWDQGFEVLMEIIREGRNEDKAFARELIDLDDGTDFKYDVCGWLDDYLDELDMREEYEQLQKKCEQLIGLFAWSEDSPSDLNFRIASAMRAQGKMDEATELCEEWYKKEEDNPQAISALIYARTAAGNLVGAEELVEKYISEDTECDEENDIIFTAASHLYNVNGNKKAEKRIEKELEAYDKRLEEFFDGMDEDEEDFDWDEEELPFN